MKKMLFALLSAAHIIPAQAMFAHFGRTVGRIGPHAGNQRMPITAQSALIPQSTFTPAMLPRSLAAQRLAHAYSTMPNDAYRSTGGSRTDEESQDSHQGSGYTRFFSPGAGLSLGFSLFGHHVLGSDDALTIDINNLNKAHQIKQISQDFNRLSLKQQKEIIRQAEELLKETHINSEVVCGFTQLITDNFAHIQKNFEPNNLIKNIIAQDTKTFPIFATKVLDHYTTCLSSYKGQRLISYIVENDPSYIPAFLNKAFMKTMQKAERDLIKIYISHNPQAFTQIAATHFSELLIKTPWIFREIKKTDPAALSVFTQRAYDIFPSLIQEKSTIELLHWFIEAFHDGDFSLFIEKTMQYFNVLVKHDEGLDFLNKAIASTPSRLPDLMPLILEHFNTIQQRSNGLRFIASITKFAQKNACAGGDALAEKVFESFPALSAQLVNDWHLEQFIVEHPTLALKPEHFAMLIGSEKGKWYLLRMIENNRDLAAHFTDLSFQHFNTIIQDTKGIVLLLNIIKHNPAAAARATNLVLEQFEIVIQEFVGAELIKMIIKHHPNAAVALTPIILKHFATGNNIQELSALFPLIIKHNATASQQIIDLILTNFTVLTESDRNIDSLTELINNNPQTAKLFIEPALTGFSLFAKRGAFKFVYEIIKQFPEAIEPFTEPMAAAFPEIISDYYTILAIKYILQANPAYVTTFTQATLKHFKSIMEIYNAKELFPVLLEHNPSCADALLEVYIKYCFSEKPTHFYENRRFLQNLLSEKCDVLLRPDLFALYIQSYENICALVPIIEKNPKKANQFTDLILEHFSSLIENNRALRVVETVLKYDPTGANRFYKPILENFSTIQNDSYGQKIIAKIIKQLPDAAISFCKPIIEAFKDSAFKKTGLIKILIAHNHHALEIVSKLMSDNFLSLISSSDGRELLQDVLVQHPNVTELFIEPILLNAKALVDYSWYDNRGIDIIKTIIVKYPATIDRFKVLAENHSIEELQKFIALLPLREKIAEMFKNKSTQTTQHFKALQMHNFKKLIKFFPSEEKSVHAFFRMIENIINTEEKEQEKGNYTFVHAYPWNIRFLQDLDAHLRAIVYDTPKQPLSLRFFTAPDEADGDKYEMIRKKILENGPSGYYAQDGNKQKYMIFMNYALLTNQVGSNTLQYIANDRCENPPKLLLDNVFKHLNLATYLDKYRTEIEELQVLHRNASMFGGGILFSFTQEMLKESVYVCYGGGKKRKVFITGIGETDDVKLILDTLRTTPEKIKDLDHLEFVFVVTKDCALNPRVIESDAYTAIPFNAADLDALTLYEQKRNALMARIADDITAERASWNEEEKTNHHKKIKNMQAWFATFHCLNGCESQSRLQEV